MDNVLKRILIYALNKSSSVERDLESQEAEETLELKTEKRRCTETEKALLKVSLPQIALFKKISSISCLFRADCCFGRESG